MRLLNMRKILFSSAVPSLFSMKCPQNDRSSPTVPAATASMLLPNVNRGSTFGL